MAQEREERRLAAIAGQAYARLNRNSFRWWAVAGTIPPRLGQHEVLNCCRYRFGTKRARASNVVCTANMRGTEGELRWSVTTILGLYNNRFSRPTWAKR